MLPFFKSWTKGTSSPQEVRSIDDTWLSFPNNASEDADVYLPKEELSRINDRIKHCLDFDTDFNEGVDHTLRLMREETQHWQESDDVDNDNDNDNQQQWRQHETPIMPGSILQFKDSSSPVMDDELLGYCLRLERNNAYLMQLVEKYEQVSFKKRYRELMMSNESLQKEYNRLKATNGKVYTSYCDLLEEIKKMKEASGKLKQELVDAKKDKNSESVELRRLQSQIRQLKIENETHSSKVRDLRTSNSALNKKLSEKEDEVIKLRAVNVATSLKLERAEKLVLKQQQTPNLKPKSDLEFHFEVKPEHPLDDDPILEQPSSAENGDENQRDLQPDDTIALLQARYQTKSMLPT